MVIPIENGEYTIAVTLSGGSGKVSVESPAMLHVENGVIQAEIVWSSPNYDYMEVDGTAYYPINKEGNSVFLIEVAALDTDIPILAETVAMSQPHMIAYTLHFDSASLKRADADIGTFLYIGAGFILLTAIAAAVPILKRKKKSNEADS